MSWRKQRKKAIYQYMKGEDGHLKTERKNNHTRFVFNDTHGFVFSTNNNLREEIGMNELIPTQQNDEGTILVTGRDLHDFLEVTTPYTMWIKRMTEYGFVEGSDFITKMLESSGGRPGTDHHIKLDMAKEISMLQRNEKGKQARQYFIELERKWNSPEMIVQRAMEIQQKKIEQLEAENN